MYGSYLRLCEATLELATNHIEKLLEPLVREAICELADEMLGTAEVFQPTQEQIDGWQLGK